jgi:uncharacterized protein YoxC
VELALAIFNIGAGIGILAAGVALLYLAIRAGPLLRETRALASDARRVTGLLDTELRPILASARELSGNVEVLSEDVAVKLDRLTDLMNALQVSLDTVQITAAPRHPEPPRVESSRPIESWDAPEWDAPEERTIR